jgi:RNA polymerase sigma-70 factor (ECF subfamily)
MNPAATTQSSLAARYPQLRSALLAHLRRWVGDAAAAEDLLHDVIVKTLKAERDGHEHPSNLGGWLYTLARNAATDYLRARRPNASLDEPLAANEESSVSEELLQCLRPLAARLPDTYRDTVIAAEFDQIPLATIAAAEGVSLSAIKSRTNRGRKLLRAEVAKCCAVSLAPEGGGLEYNERKLERCGGGCSTPADRAEH